MSCWFLDENEVMKVATVAGVNLYKHPNWDFDEPLMFHCDEIYGADAGVYVSSGISYERNRMDYDADAVVAAFKKEGGTV